MLKKLLEPFCTLAAGYSAVAAIIGIVWLFSLLGPVPAAEITAQGTNLYRGGILAGTSLLTAGLLVLLIMLLVLSRGLAPAKPLMVGVLGVVAAVLGVLALVAAIVAHRNVTPALLLALATAGVTVVAFKIVADEKAAARTEQAARQQAQQTKQAAAIETALRQEVEPAPAAEPAESPQK